METFIKKDIKDIMEHRKKYKGVLYCIKFYSRSILIRQSVKDSNILMLNSDDLRRNIGIRAYEEYKLESE